MKISLLLIFSIADSKLSDQVANQTDGMKIPVAPDSSSHIFTTGNYQHNQKLMWVTKNGKKINYT